MTNCQFPRKDFIKSSHQNPTHSFLTHFLCSCFPRSKINLWNFPSCQSKILGKCSHFFSSSRYYFILLCNAGIFIKNKFNLKWKYLCWILKWILKEIVLLKKDVVWMDAKSMEFCFIEWFLLRVFRVEFFNWMLRKFCCLLLEMESGRELQF
jgi:hypothetical protein